MIAATDPLEEAERYCEAVLAGEIPAGKYVRNAVARHFADLDREGDNDFPYYFDKDEAGDYCIFFPIAFRHAKSKWSGDAFELSPWQLFCTATLFGWKRKDGTRRFRRSHISVARKNGKTTWCGGLSILLALIDREAAAEVYIGATKKDQARILFSDAQAMIRQSPHLKKHAKVFRDNITFPLNHSFIRPLSSDKPFDGLNPHGVFFDELHAYKEQQRPFYDTMRTGSGARPQPLICTITTAGSDRSPIWIEEVNYVKAVLDGTVQDEALFGFIASIDEEDDPLDESCWIKANPNLGVSVDLDYLREQSKEARVDPVSMNRFKRYHCNIMVASTERAIDPELWNDAEAELDDWREADCITAGFDLGGRDDLASVAYCARFQIDEDEEGIPIYRYEFKTKSYICVDTKRNLAEEPFASFLSTGQITKCKFLTQQIQFDLIRDCEEMGIQYVAYDPHQAKHLAEMLEEEGLAPVNMPQNYAQFNEPIQSFLAMLTEGRIKHNGDPVLKWAATNAVVVYDRSGEKVMFDKAASREKIDPIVASVMAFKASLAAPPPDVGPAFFA